MERGMNPRNLRKNQSGAFDLPSILIGVAVVAILAVGVMAAVFGVIPWAQDRATKQDLAAITTSQGASYAHSGSFTDKAALVGAGWLGDDTPADLDARADADGKCYVAITTSKTGQKFIVSSDKPTPRTVTSSDTWCNGTRIIRDTSPVMITTWNTGLDPRCQEITLPLGGSLDGSVTWGDGTKDSKTSHVFAAAGEVTIRIDGKFSRWGGIREVWTDSVCLVSVDRWGETGTRDLSEAFREANNLKHVEEIPSSATNMSEAFYLVQSDFTIGRLDTSNVTDMRRMFAGAKTFNQPVNFDTANVTDMNSMFQNAEAFNQPVNFDTAKVTGMHMMFYNSYAFNQPVNFDTAKVTIMENMFYNARAFNKPVNFDTRNVGSLGSMFWGARAFNQPVNFDAPNITTATYMFADATSFNQPVTLSHTTKLTNTAAMFYGARAFNQTVTIDTSNVTAMGYMFSDARAFNQPVNLDTSSATAMNYMFEMAYAFNQPLKFDTSKVKTMDNMFDSAEAYNQDLSAWDVRMVETHMSFDSYVTRWTLPRPPWVR